MGSNPNLPHNELPPPCGSGNSLIFLVISLVYLDRGGSIGPDTLNLLRQLRADQAEKAISQFVFTKEGSPDMMHPQSPTRYFKRFGQKYGVDDFHPHKLRHTSPSTSLSNGGDLASVSRRLGHSSAAVTARIYVHANEEGMRRAGQIARDALKEQGK